MTDNINKPQENELSEAEKRAARIKAIRSAIHSEPEPAPEPPKAEAADEWQTELAERLAKIKQEKDSKAASAVEEIIAEAEEAAEEAAKEAEEENEAEPAPELIPEAEAPPEEPTAETVPEDPPVTVKPVPPPRPVRRTMKAAPIPPSQTQAAPPFQAAETAAAPEPPRPSGKKKKKKKKKTLGQSIRGLFPQKGDSILERVRKLVFLGSVAAIVVCGYMVSDYYLDLWMNRRKSQDVADIYHIYEPVYNDTEETQEMKRNKTYVLLDAAKKLLDINDEIVGFMTIEGTPIDIPVMQTKDNSKYLDLNFRGEESRAGALFLDWRNHFDDVDDQGHLKEDNSGNLVVYGHNMADDSMFGSLKYYQRNADYYDQHPLIHFNSNYEYYTYKIFAFFIVDAEDESPTKYDCWNHLDFTSEEEFYDFVNEAKRHSIRLNDVDVKYGDQILTLSTCNTILGDRGRLIIMARQVRTFEDVENWAPKSWENPNIKYPTMYYNSRPDEKYDPDAEFVPYGPDEDDEAEE